MLHGKTSLEKILLQDVAGINMVFLENKFFRWTEHIGGNPLMKIFPAS